MCQGAGLHRSAVHWHAPVTAENVKPGTHQVNVSAEGSTESRRRSTSSPASRSPFASGGPAQRDARRGPQAPHGIVPGAAGRHAEGIRYDTTTRTIGSPALADLESFVDYQDKNLRIKVRKGKQYASPIPTATPIACSSFSGMWTRRGRTSGSRSSRSVRRSVRTSSWRFDCGHGQRVL